MSDRGQQAGQMNALAFACLSVDPQKALLYAQKALTTARENKLVPQMGKAHNHLASYYAGAGQIEKAFEHYDSSLYYNRQSNTEVGVANVLNNMGVLHYRLGHYDQALQHYFDALRVFEKLGDHAGMGRGLLNAANVYMEQNNYEKAIHYDTLALQHYKTAGNANGIASVLGNVANVCQKNKDLQKAKAAYAEALAIYRAQGNLQGIGTNLLNLATLWNEEGNHKMAQQMFAEARAVFLQINNAEGVAYATGNIGSSYYLSYTNFDKQGTAPVPGHRASLLQNAIQHLKEGVQLARSMNNLKLVEYFSQMLYQACEAAGDIPQAHIYYKIHVAAKDSLFSLESKKQIEQLTTEREVELKNKQIELDRLAVEKKRNERAYFGAGLALLLLSLVFIYRNYANQKKSNVQLSTLNRQIATSNDELTDKNLQLTQTMRTLEETQGQLIESEKQKENALIRSRISQDIHDDISAGLNKISWMAEAVAIRAAQPQAVPDITTLQRIKEGARETVSKLGEIIWSSDPERDNLQSLLEYMRRYTENYLEDSPLRGQFEFPEVVPDFELHPELRRNLYLVVKEAIHNARKYSGGNTVLVSFALSPERAYRLTVRDNGRGMEPGQVEGSGNGMRNMQRRMEAVGGRMTIESAADKGTTLTFTGKM